MDNPAAAKRLGEILRIDTKPVAVFLLGPAGPLPAASFKSLTGLRYCQLLMRARHGESVFLVPDELACPAAAAAFGFRPLPEGLATGKGLVGFGIVDDPGTGKKMFEGMPRLEAGRVRLIAAAPPQRGPNHPRRDCSRRSAGSSHVAHARRP